MNFLDYRFDRCAFRVQRRKYVATRSSQKTLHLGAPIDMFNREVYFDEETTASPLAWYLNADTFRTEDI